jgi:hypothetical protein
MNATFSTDAGMNSHEAPSHDKTLGRPLLPAAVLVKAMEEAQENEARLKKQIEELQRLLLSTQEEANILAKLIALRNGGTPPEAGTPAGHASPTNVTSAPTVSKSGHTALEAVIGILEQAERPVHISELMRLLNEKSVTIPGSGTQANLISHLRRDKRIVRPSRGMYGLAFWGLDEMLIQSKRRRKRRRRK